MFIQPFVYLFYVTVQIKKKTNHNKLTKKLLVKSIKNVCDVVLIDYNDYLKKFYI